MARPIKNNAEYFPHDADMRHDPRVKAVRRKFKLEGYAIYVMCIELLTDSDFFQFKIDKMNLEIIAGDFDCDVSTLDSVIKYCIELDLFQVSETNVLSCKSLENRFEGLLSKRERDRNRVFAGDNSQSKVKQSKVKQSISNTVKIFGNKEENQFIRIQDKTVNAPITLLYGIQGWKDFLSANMAKLQYPEHAPKFLKKYHAYQFNDFNHLHNTYMKFVEKQYA